VNLIGGKLMKIDISVLGWSDKCCGCYRVIKSTDKVYMVSEIAGVRGSIHLCENCIEYISDSRKIEVKD
jgi:hypothetical protein